MNISSEWLLNWNVQIMTQSVCPSFAVTHWLSHFHAFYYAAAFVMIITVQNELNVLHVSLTTLYQYIEIDDNFV